MCPLITVSGVRNSWLASSRNSRRVVKARSSRASMSLNVAVISDSSSLPVTGIRWVRSVSEILRAVDANDRSGRSTRPARATASNEASTSVANCTTICVRTASSISPRSKSGKFATT